MAGYVEHQAEGIAILLWACETTLDSMNIFVWRTQVGKFGVNGE